MEHENSQRGEDRGVDLISDGLPFGRLGYGEPGAVNNAIGYAEHCSRFARVSRRTLVQCTAVKQILPVGEPAGQQSPATERASSVEGGEASRTGEAARSLFRKRPRLITSDLHRSPRA
jgi:hypothetical protein